jgi:HlyD family secretion protein
MNKIKKHFHFIILFTVWLTACAQQPVNSLPENTIDANNSVVAEGHIVPESDLKLYFSVPGKIAEINVQEGQMIQKGDILAHQGDSEQAQAAVANASLEVISAQQAYDEFVRLAEQSSAQAFLDYQKAQADRAQAQLAWESIDPNKIKDDIDVAQTDVQNKKKNLDDANENLGKYLDLKADNPTRRQAESDVRKAESEYNSALRKVEELQNSIDSPRSTLDSAQASEAEALRKYENTKSNTLDPDKRAILVGRLETAKAQLKAADANLAKYDLRAPFNGLVTDVNISVGELVSGEKFAFQMIDPQSWYVETSDLSELEVVDVVLGQKVEIAPDALPGLILNGVVESISSSYRLQGGDILYTVKIKLMDQDPMLKWGMTVQATFLPTSP